MVLTALAAIATLIVGVFLGHWLRSHAAKSEKALLEQRTREAAEAAERLRGDLASVQGIATRLAGFESVAVEREKTIAALSSERDRVREDLQAANRAMRDQAARISQLEAELNNERQNMTEKVALLESAKQTLANQFEALAAEVLEKKSRSFSEGSQKELGTLLTPLREQIKEFREKVEQAQTDSKTGVTRLETLEGTLN